YQADATGARVAGKPWGLAKALEKLQMAQQVAPMEANPATAHLFIVNPLSGRAFMNLFSTHPPIEDRIARLRAMRVCRPRSFVHYARRGMMAGMSVAEVPVVARNDGLLDGDLIRRWLAWGFVWLLVFPTVGAIVAAKFNHPEFLGGVAWLSFGRLRPIPVNRVIWGAFATLFIGLAHYMVPRLCGVPVAGARLGSWLLWIWNVNLAVGVVLLALGANRGWEAGEFPLPTVIVTLGVLLALTVQFLVTIARR